MINAIIKLINTEGSNKIKQGNTKYISNKWNGGTHLQNGF